jgi:hypothetical protein
MNPDLRLDGHVYKTPMDKFTGWILGNIAKHKEGPAFLLQLKERLTASMPLKDEKLKELLDELKGL